MQRHWLTISLAAGSLLGASLAPTPLHIGASAALVMLAVAEIIGRVASHVSLLRAMAAAIAMLAISEAGLSTPVEATSWKPLLAVAAYPFLAWSMLSYAGRYQAVRRTDLLVQGVLMGAAAGIFLQWGVDGGVTRAADQVVFDRTSFSSLLVGLDVALLVIVARSLRLATARFAAIGAATAGVLALMTGHLVSTTQLVTAQGPGFAAELLVGVALAGLGAAISCSLYVESSSTPSEAPLFSSTHAAVVVAALVAPPLVIVLGAFKGFSVSPTAATAIALSGAVMAIHLVLLLRERASGEHQATHDALTDLPNRVLYMDRLDRAITQADRHGELVGVLYIDLDRFKDVNDTLGHKIGDELLRSTAARLTSATRDEDTLARLAGDEFAVLLPRIGSVDEAIAVGERMLKDLSQPIALADHSVRNPASIGVAVFPHDASNAEDLLAAADAAMYRAKDQGGDMVEVNGGETSLNATTLLETETALYNALERHELVLHYQPIIDARTDGVVGAEALVRWEHPSKGLIFPGKFIPVAERSDLIVLIGEWALNTACAELARWSEAGHGDRFIAVNVSARHFRHDLVSAVTSALRTYAVDPSRLVVELTESTAAEDLEIVSSCLSELRELGVRAAIDDFGTGYSGLQYLGDLPVSTLKIDRSFIRSTTSRTAAIVAATITMSHSLGIQVVAEGVENAEQKRFLVDNGCDRLQGYHLGRPMPSREMLAMFSSNRGPEVTACAGEEPTWEGPSTTDTMVKPR